MKQDAYILKSGKTPFQERYATSSHERMLAAHTSKCTQRGSALLTVNSEAAPASWTQETVRPTRKCRAHLRLSATALPLSVCVTLSKLLDLWISSWPSVSRITIVLPHRDAMKSTGDRGGEGIA